MENIQKRLRGWASNIRRRFQRNSDLTDSTAGLVERSHGNPTTTDYTELMSGNSELQECPSCQGTGRIPKELAETLVALIPMSDDRLKPKKTAIYVSIGVALCLVFAVVLIFFFLPRTVILSTDNMPIEVVHVFDRDNVSHSRIDFYFSNAVNVTNSNYFPVDVVNVSATIISKFQPWSMDIVGKGFNQTSLRISPFGGNNQRIWFNNTVSLTGVVA